MITAHLILTILALVSFLAAAVGYNPPRTNLIAAGLFLWVLSGIVA